MAKSAFDQGKRVSPNNQTIGGKAPKKDPKYADPPAVKPDDSKKLTDFRDKFAPNADKATSASADKGQTDLPAIMQSIDPQGNAQQFPQMYQQAMMMISILAMGSGMGGGGGGSGNFGAGVVPFVPSGVVNVLEDSLTGALAILVRNHGFERVIEILVLILSNNGINQIDSGYRNLVLNSVANLIKVALYYGPDNIPVSAYNEAIFGIKVPNAVNLITDVPDGWIEQFYNIQDDPYPGYREFKHMLPGLNSTAYERMWVKREPKSYVYESASEAIYSYSEMSIATLLDPYFKIGTTYILTAAILNTILVDESYNVETNTLNTTMGNGAGNQNQGGGGGGGNGLAGMMGGQLQQLMGLMQGEQLPQSVLNQGQVGKVLQQYTKDMALNNQIFELGKGALGGGQGGALGSMGNMGGMSNIMGGFGAGGGGIGGVLGNLGGGNLLGSFGGFGGNSGGGGGGAGSGFPGASGGGSYSGGGISSGGMKNVSQLLTLLGIS